MATTKPVSHWAAGDRMPSLFRFVFFVGLLAGLAAGGLFVLSEFFEPEQREVTQSVPGVKIRR